MKRLLSIICVAAAVVVSTPSHAQKMSMNELQHHCKKIFTPTNCERVRVLGNKAIIAFAEALAVLLHDGFDEANKELDRLLGELEQGRNITNRKAIKKGIDI